MTKLTCEEACLQLCADSRTISPPLREHLAQCEGCRAYQSGNALLEADLRRAFDLGPPFPRKKPLQKPESKPEPAAASLPPLRPKPFIRPRTWAMAASLVLAVLGGMLLWTARASDSLARDLTTHVTIEAHSWGRTDIVPPETIDQVMKRSGLKLKSGQDRVVFARTCFVHGHLVPHLVVRTAEGPIAVVVMPDEPASTASSFHASDVTAVVLPAPRGSIAVLTQQAVLSMDVARQIADEVSWDSR